MLEKFCKECGRLIKGRRKSAKFCDAHCRNLHWTLVHRPNLQGDQRNRSLEREKNYFERGQNDIE